MRCLQCKKELSKAKTRFEATYCSDKCRRAYISSLESDIKLLERKERQMRKVIVVIEEMERKALKVAEAFDTLETYSQAMMEQHKEYVVFKESI